MFSYSIKILGFSMLILTRSASMKPLDGGDIIFPDELELYSQIFSNKENITSDVSTQHNQVEEITVGQKMANLTISLDNRYLIHVPCKKGHVRIRNECRIEFKK